MNISELKLKLSQEETNVGCWIGWLNNNLLSYLIYLGDENFLFIFEGGSGGSGIKPGAFEYLKKLVDNVTDQNTTEFITIKYLEEIEDFQTEFYKYDFNIFTAISAGNLKPVDIFNNIRYNLNQIETLEDGDIIYFKRSCYNHSAVLVDKVRMLCVHRSGEPNLTMVSCCIDKALVTKDHLIDIAQGSRLTKSNHIFDKHAAPKPKEEIVEEANRRVGEVGYNLTSANCQHFASEVRNGTAISPEVEMAKTGGALIVGAALVGIILGKAVSVFIDSRCKQNETKKENCQIKQRP